MLKGNKLSLFIGLKMVIQKFAGRINHDPKYIVYILEKKWLHNSSPFIHYNFSISMQYHHKFEENILELKATYSLKFKCANF